jgi:hypothetical protein
MTELTETPPRSGMPDATMQPFEMLRIWQYWIEWCAIVLKIDMQAAGRILVLIPHTIFEN